uniref:Neur_chan_LBD domain-containing protein n=1 Tax=Macrostomum lignano TaxID=282301 RepID=A0A1I8JJY5_9PLAT
TLAASGMSARLLICLALLGAAVSAAASPASPDDAVAAALKLFTEYNKAIRPPPDSGFANTLNVFIYLNSIVKVDSANQEIKLKVWLHVHWTDSRLAWKGKFNSSLDNISAISLPASYLWQPDASFYDV